MRRLLVILIAGALTLLACTSDDNGGAANPTPPPSTTTPSPEVTATPEPVEVAPTVSPEPEAPPSSPSISSPDPVRPPSLVVVEYTTYDWSIPSASSPGKVATKLRGSAQIELVSVRTGRHDNKGFDRIVFKFRGGQPGTEFWYGPKPSTPGEGGPVDLPGKPNAFLHILMEAATGHDEQGKSVIEHLDPFKTGYSALVGYAVHDFEGVEADLGFKFTLPSDPGDVRVATMVTQESDGEVYDSLVFDIIHN